VSGINGILEIGKRSLTGQRVGIDVTSHNIANASTPGYSRQRLTLQTTEPIKETYGLLGTGVTMVSIDRLREGFIDQQVRNANTYLGEASQQARILGQIEAATNEPSESGLGAMMTRLFNAFQDLSLHPEESASRNNVVQSASMMSDTFHRLTAGLVQLKGDLALDTEARVDQINRIVKEIYDVDQRILGLKASGVAANDALDIRDRKLDELSTLADVKVSVDDLGSVLISLGGMQLESRTGYIGLTTKTVGTTLTVVTEGTSIPVTVQSGELGGILETLNVTIPGYESKLDTLASALITRINQVHAAGFGVGNPVPTGINFFTGSGAKDIAVNNVIVANIGAVASSSDGAPGNNDVAVALARVQNELLLNGNSSTIGQFYNGFISDLGATVQTVANDAESQQLVLKQLENQRSSISGVSIDEEMVELIKFQRGFDAAAKVINTVNEMYLTIIEMV
jgi:flagellar hook-associated protein 1 FlgK